MKIKQSDLAKEIDEILANYTEEVYEASQKAAYTVSEEVAERLAMKSPRRNHSGKHYAEGWTVGKERDGYVVYNATKPRLTHLLEKGHATRNGGFVSGKRHIRPAELWGIAEYIRRVKGKI